MCEKGVRRIKFAVRNWRIRDGKGVMTRQKSQTWPLFCESKTPKQPGIDLGGQSIRSHYTFAFVAQQSAFL